MNELVNKKKIEECIKLLSEEYGQLLYREWLLNTDITEDLNIQDLFLLDAKIKRNISEAERKKRIFKIAILTVTFVYVFGGMLIVAYSLMHRNDGIYTRQELQLLLGCMTTIVGFLSGVGTLLLFPKFKRIRKNRLLYERKIILQHEIVYRWAALETYVDSISLKRGLGHINSVVEFLQKEKSLSEEDLVIVVRFLRMRNEIMHEDSISYSQEDMKNTLVEIDRIIEKIDK